MFNRFWLVLVVVGCSSESSQRTLVPGSDGGGSGGAGVGVLGDACEAQHDYCEGSDERCPELGDCADLHEAVAKRWPRTEDRPYYGCQADALGAPVCSVVCGDADEAAFCEALGGECLLVDSAERCYVR